MLTKKIPGFTIAELLVTLALTGVLAGFSYMGLNYIQRLLKKYNNQSFFLAEANELYKRMEMISSGRAPLQKEMDGRFTLNADTGAVSLDIKDKLILLTRYNKTDTFHLEPRNIQAEYELPGVSQTRYPLVKEISFDVYFEKQKFHFNCRKQYDACTKLALQKELNNELD